MTIAVIKKKIVPILKKGGVKKAAIFGSYARGEENKSSDVDILLELKKGSGLFDLIGLKLDLEKRLGKKVDVLTYGGIYYALKDIILKEQKVIYEERP
ncbi:nucleotidyltransferase family protein [Candidatus Peregrinibacteria bacterium]|nr:nucleotidyltransferase family protein [Candidatus Peregrinibacteria bacterium]